MRISRSLAFTQAVIALIIGLSVGVGVTVLDVALSFRREAEDLHDTALEVVQTAAAAVLIGESLTTAQAEQLASALVDRVYFDRVVVSTDAPLATARRAVPTRLPPVFAWFERHYGSTRLIPIVADDGTTAGRIAVELSVEAFVQQFRHSTFQTTVRYLAASLGIVLLVGFAFYKWITKPVLELTAALERIDFVNPRSDTIVEPRGHGDDEIGVLAEVVKRIMRDAADASRQRRAYERQLRESESRFRRIYENVQDGYYETDIRGNLLEVSPSFERMTGYDRNELIGRSIVLLYESPRERDRMIDSLLESGRLQDYEVTLVRRSGVPFRCSLQAELSRGEGSKPVGTLGSVRDISARKQAEEKVRASLAEKEVLLREIHHRVKNNLQIISSLLHLQEGMLVDGDDRPFLDSQNRIAAMALLHEELYESETLSNVDIKSYVTKLAGQLAQVYDPSGAVALNLRVDDIHMQMDAAVPCGLVINELVTNSYKHAFTNGNAGRLSVELVRTKPGRLRLAVADSGDGFPDDFDVGSVATLGMSLVQSLAEQLAGTARFENREGAYCTVEFPVPPLRTPS